MLKLKHLKQSDLVCSAIARRERYLRSRCPGHKLDGMTIVWAIRIADSWKSGCWVPQELHLVATTFMCDPRITRLKSECCMGVAGAGTFSKVESHRIQSSHSEILLVPSNFTTSHKHRSIVISTSPFCPLVFDAWRRWGSKLRATTYTVCKESQRIPAHIAHHCTAKQVEFSSFTVRFILVHWYPLVFYAFCALKNMAHAEKVVRCFQLLPRSSVEIRQEHQGSHKPSICRSQEGIWCFACPCGRLL